MQTINSIQKQEIKPENEKIDIRISDLKVSCYSIPTSTVEADGTFEWEKTQLVLAEVEAEGETGIGYTYADLSTALFIDKVLKKEILKESVLDIAGVWAKMISITRNLGRQGISSMAISAVDNALWDLKAKLLNIPLVTLLGQVHEKLPLYGSGGFTNYSDQQLKKQFEEWASQGIKKFKMKIGRDPQKDVERVKQARKIIGEDADLFVDANGAYTRKQALSQAFIFKDFNVKWFEEPVPSDDLQGLSLIRNQGPPGMDIAAGEYGYDLVYFTRMLENQAVDVLQADATRCAGITGFIKTATLCEAFNLPLSAHCAPILHLHPCCAALPIHHAEYFYDHVRIEQMLFEGIPQPKAGYLFPNLSTPGLGVQFKHTDAEKFKIG